MQKKLKDRIAIVTGAAAGIGFATAKLFLEEGAAAVAICDVSGERVETAVAALTPFGQVRGHVADVSKKEMCVQLAEKTLAEFHRVDILINNAGITSDAQFYKMTDEQFERVLDVNLKGTYYMSKAVIPAMMEQKYGKIVHASSVSAYNGNFGQTNYAASKAAIAGMTRVMGKELGKYGINVNAVAPGSIMTDMYSAVPEEAKQKKLASIPLRRYGVPEEAAQLIAFLASEEAAYITAQTITIDGGFN
ncbi:MAG: glucose 1-dehydrogenase [Synergistaceae bacterium]|jgi:3-oxoacyl-[acyl-carrier protein] reductase|nr:glucose 1-dehydrogenase [Synergistaceae bacterium]